MRREQVVIAAQSWVGTPYHHMARVKGAGCDCGQLIIAAFVEAGAVPDFDTGHYTMDWHLHRSEERYLGFVETYLSRHDEVYGERSLADRVLEDPSYTIAPGDVIVWRVGRTFSHGGLVTGWPNFVHAYLPSGIVEEVSLLGTPMAERPMRVYTFRGFDE